MWTKHGWAKYGGTGTLLLSWLLAGCTVGPKYHPPIMQAPNAYKEAPGSPSANSSQPPPANGTPGAQASSSAPAGAWTVARPQDDLLRGNWWEVFHDPELNDLESRLNIDNQNIKVAFENFMEARALIQEARAQYFPTVGTAPSWNRNRASGNLRNASSALSTGVTANSGATTSVYTLPLEISWAPDLWGKVRNTVHLYQYQAQVTAAELQSERLTEQVDLAEYFYELRGQDALIQLYDHTIAADQKALQLAQAGFETGVGDKISVVEAQSTLASVQSEATNLGILRAQYEHAIAMLIGKPASEFSLAMRPMTAAPPPLPIGLPSQLLERRPDIAAAERSMAGANAQIGIADAAFYPNLTLSASGGFQSGSISKLLEWPSRIWSIGPTVSETVFDAGLRRATVHEYTAIYNSDLANYRQTVLTAFQQVEDNLARVRILSQQLEQQKVAVSAAQSALNLEMARFQSGVDPYINVVTLQTNLLTQQQTFTNLQIEEMTGATELVGALGGGWDRTQLPTPAQVSQRTSKADTSIQH